MSSVLVGERRMPLMLVEMMDMTTTTGGEWGLFVIRTQDAAFVGLWADRNGL